MKSIVLGIFIVLLSIAPASAAPFLVSDPMPSAVGGSFEIQENGAAVAIQSNQPDGSIRFDLEGIKVGSHAWQVRYVVENGVWGKAYSAFVPFEFTKPGSVTDPIKGPRLATE